MWRGGRNEPPRAEGSRRFTAGPARQESHEQPEKFGRERTETLSPDPWSIAD